METLTDDKPDLDMVVCPDCNGDGKDTCHNPDHGFIQGIGWTDIGRLGCPVCGHSPTFKAIKGGPCDTCKGTGKVAREVAELYTSENGE